MATLKPVSRREMLGLTLTATAGFAFSTSALAASNDGRGFKIGACDWSIGKMGDPEAFLVAKEIGLDGLQVSLGSERNDMHLRRPEVQEQYKAAVRQSGLKIGSLAIGELNNIPYKSDPRAVKWVEDAIDTSSALKVRVILLAFFAKGDLIGDAAGKDEVVRRLKAVAPKAERAGVILGIESWLSAREHLEIIDRVESKAVQVYYDVCNSTDRGYDIFREIRELGAKRICEFHAKENGALLGKGKVDFHKVRRAMDDIGYRGWIQIEGAVPPGGELLASYKDNLRFLREIFST